MRRVLIHIPVGLANAFIAFVSGWLGLVFGVGFIAYELWEGLRVTDRAWIDLKGYLVGIGIGAVAWAVAELLV